jgi:predicted acetyltransferase
VSLEVRRLTPELVPAYAKLVGRTFWGSEPTDEQLERWMGTLEIERGITVVDGAQVVATAGAHSIQVTLPGGVVTGAAGVSRVSVRPTHRRRGLLTAMMRRQLDDLREEGEGIALLHASEAGIYGRFGYGPGTYAARLEIERARSAFRAPVAGGRVREVDGDEALRLLPALHGRAAPRHPGFVQRDRGWWERILDDAPDEREGQGQLVVLVHGGDDGLDGYAGYRPEMEAHGGTLHLQALVAVSDGAYAALWRHCLDVDLMARVVAEGRSVDEPLRFLLADPRAPETRVQDGLWVRLVDVPAALEARRYLDQGRLRFRLEDTFCPWNAGTYELECGPDGVSCGRTEAEPDLVLPAAALGACYLGGNRFTTLARAGVVDECVPGALVRADALFATDVAPWNPVHF